jgi:hypothetical protein
MITEEDVEAIRREYARAQATADEAFAAMLSTRPLAGSKPVQDASALLEAWIRQREAADGLALAYVDATRAHYLGA